MKRSSLRRICKWVAPVIKAGRSVPRWMLVVIGAVSTVVGSLFYDGWFAPKVENTTPDMAEIHRVRRQLDRLWETTREAEKRRLADAGVETPRYQVIRVEAGAPKPVQPVPATPKVTPVPEPTERIVEVEKAITRTEAGPEVRGVLDKLRKEQSE